MRCTIEQLNAARAAKRERRCRGESVGGRWKALTAAEAADRAGDTQPGDWHVGRLLEIEAWRSDAVAVIEARYAETLRRIRGEPFEEIPF